MRASKINNVFRKKTISCTKIRKYNKPHFNFTVVSKGGTIHIFNIMATLFTKI